MPALSPSKSPMKVERFDESKIRELNVAYSLYGMLYAFDHL